MAEIPTAPLAYNLHIFIDDVPQEEIGQTEEISADMKKCYSLSRTVKYLATIDFFFAAMYAFFNYYFLIPMMLIYFGYIGAKEYKITYTITYLIYTIPYQYISSICIL